MAVVILPDAQADLLGLQDYMLDKWGEASWLKAEDEIFDKLAKVDAGLFNGSPVQELASVGILDYLNVYTSHHKLVYRKAGHETYVYLVAGQRQDFPTLLMKRLFKI
ncbi:type II toxin-antitoxin system RelE/ParE family toxin [Rhodoferax sp.]|uniref:type II toxin-antitoxin system RelE/ParE family toxin n=1 Tax=Rhodoferax sp. TaxID=50421 RepID=UPI002616B2FE|nr:type II toxin-antitoxin system RelE/ParE family toxin [Rhodoferax sp.]MDD5480867.1 type II toxin-antitoxin system RelE/ParE family toxin [Rhodoferax sp.]